MKKYFLSKRLKGEEKHDLGNLTPFAKISKMKQEYLATHENPLLDFGIGESDDAASPLVIRKLHYEARQWENRIYADNGIDEFKSRAASYLNDLYDLCLRKENINHCIGAKSALAILPFLFIDEKDYVITTTPGYAVLKNVSKWLGAKVYECPLTKENNYLPDLEAIPKKVLKKAKLLYLNYPNNPTGAVANLAFFEKVVAFAKQHHIFVVHDAAYLPLVFHKEDQVSFLQAQGAIDIGCEIHTLSKGHNMTGWRIGFIASNPEIIALFAKVKDVIDSGQFIPIQKAAITALNHPEIVEKNVEKYQRRHQLICDVLNKVGIQSTMPKATFYQYVDVPKQNQLGRVFQSGADFAYYLLSEHGILVIPWDEAGNHVRFSMTFVAKNEEEEKMLAEELFRRLAEEKFTY